MKIAVINSTIFPTFPPNGTSGYAGLEVLAWQQAEGLAQKGHEVTLFGADGTVCNHAKVFAFGPPGGQTSEQQAYSRYWPELLKQDVIVDHGWAKWSYSLKAEGRLKAPVLAWMHAPVNTMMQNLPPVKKPCFVCISDDQKSHFEALFAPAQARRCYNGIDVNHYRSLGVPRSGRFLFLARFSKIKGASLAIDACLQVGAGLDLVGDTTITNEPDYFNECRSKCDGKQIRMVGPASRGECVWWMSQAHALLHPNFLAPALGHPGFREPFGLAPVEAMACGCPVIAGDFGAMRETVKTGPASTSTGRLVNNFDEFTASVKYAIFSDPVYDGENMADIWRKNCRERAADFTVERMVNRVEELCTEALETGGW